MFTFVSVTLAMGASGKPRIVPAVGQLVRGHVADDDVPVEGRPVGDGFGLLG